MLADLVLRQVHGSFAWFVIGSNAVAGLWALGAHWFAPLRARALWWCVGLAEMAIAIQVILGVSLVVSAKLELPRFHAFYGFFSLFFVGFMYAYRVQLRHRLYVMYGLGGLFLMGLAMRAFLLHR